MTGYLIALGLFVVLGGLLFVPALWAWRRYRGTRVVTCPETQEPAAVEVDSAHAAATAFLARPELRLANCSRWPEKSHCGQMCLDQIEASPEDCLVRSILGHWYAGKSCVFCGWRFDVIHWHDHKPALRSPDGRIVSWRGIPPEKLPETLATHEPVCWNCDVVETFRKEHPELVVERPDLPKPLHRHPW